MIAYQQLDMFELTNKVCDTAKRIADGEIVSAADKLDLAELMYEARRRIPANREFGAWWQATGISYSRPWRAILLRAGERIASDGRPVVNPVNNGGEFSIKRFARTGDGWISGDDEVATDSESQSDESDDEWYTPAWLFDALGLRFDIDVCAPIDRTYMSTPADQIFTKDDDGLAQDWDGLIWCNPPYSDATPWAERMIEHGNGILLSHVPINGLWCLRAWNAALVVRLLQGMEFVRPSGALQRPAYWLQLVAFGSQAASALWTLDDRLDIDIVPERFRPSRPLVPTAPM